MDQLVEVLKYISAILVVLAPLLKLFPGRTGQRQPREFEERYQRIQAFFEAGGVERHPFLVEAAFAAAVGHSKLNAIEIPLVLRQPRPTQFMNTYVRVRDYLAPTQDGLRFELRSIASLTRLRKILVGVGVLMYLVFMLAAVWLAFHAAPKLILSQSWSSLVGAFSFAALFAAAAAWCLVGASRLHWAARLEARQQ